MITLKNLKIFQKRYEVINRDGILREKIQIKDLKFFKNGTEVKF